MRSDFKLFTKVKKCKIRHSPSISLFLCKKFFNISPNYHAGFSLYCEPKPCFWSGLIILQTKFKSRNQPVLSNKERIINYLLGNSAPNVTATTTMKSMMTNLYSSCPTYVSQHWKFIIGCFTNNRKACRTKFSSKGKRGSRRKIILSGSDPFENVKLISLVSRFAPRISWLEAPNRNTSSLFRDRTVIHGLFIADFIPVLANVSCLASPLSKVDRICGMMCNGWGQLVVKFFRSVYLINSLKMLNLNFNKYAFQWDA